MKSYGTEEIARMCSVTRPTVGRWITKGKLPIYTTPGGHRRVWENDLIAFLKSYNIRIPKILGGNPVSILVVDDELHVRRVICKTLKKLYPHFKVYEASNGFEAGYKVTSLVPSLVILDLKLPGVDGIEICRTIRNDRNLSGVKILAITGFSIRESKQKALAVGADAFLQKPFLAEELAEHADHLLPKKILT